MQKNNIISLCLKESRPFFNKGPLRGKERLRNKGYVQMFPARRQREKEISASLRIDWVKN